MNINHDQQWLDNNAFTAIVDDEGGEWPVECVDECKAYHEHMKNRWLPMVFLPEKDQRIEICWRSRSRHPDWSSVEEFDGEFIDISEMDKGGESDDMLGHQIAWRPAGALPE